MTNKYLEKIAANRFEKHLLSQPEGKVYEDAAVTRTAKNLHAAARIQRNAHSMAELGAKPEALKRMAAEAKTLIRDHRSPGSPFAHMTRKSLERAAQTAHRKNIFARPEPGMSLKQKLGFGALGLATAGLGTYGIVDEINDD